MTQVIVLLEDIGAKVTVLREEEIGQELRQVPVYIMVLGMERLIPSGHVILLGYFMTYVRKKGTGLETGLLVRN